MRIGFPELMILFTAALFFFMSRIWIRERGPNGDYDANAPNVTFNKQFGFMLFLILIVFVALYLMVESLSN